MEKTITIGSQIWTSENLNVNTYRNGDVIPEVQDQNAWRELTTGAWCYYKNDASNGTKYVKLYNWYAVNDPRGLAPVGFHIPSDAEWSILTDYLGGEAGTKMKSASGWNGTNSSGGYRYDEGAFYSIGIGCWWSSSDGNTSDVIALTYAWYRHFTGYDGSVTRSFATKTRGFSVRCLRD